MSIQRTKLYKMLKNFQKIKLLFFVTHKESALRFCNKIYEIKMGNWGT